MSDTRAITIQHMIAAWNSLPEQYGVEQRMGAAMNVAVAEEQAARHADLGALMEATGVANDGISPPAELFKRCIAQLAKAPQPRKYRCAACPYTDESLAKARADVIGECAMFIADEFSWTLPMYSTQETNELTDDVAESVREQAAVALLSLAHGGDDALSHQSNRKEGR